MKILGRIGILIGCLAISGCDSSFAPVNPRRIDPIPDAYRIWWEEVEACTGTAADLEQVTWWKIDQFWHRDSDRWAGFWKKPHDIYIVEAYELSRGVVKHEMVHNVLQTTDHESPLFCQCSRCDG